MCMQVKIRRATEGDSRDFWTWRNHSAVKKWCLHSGEIDYAAHQKWFSKKINDKNAILYIAENENREKLGQARFDIEQNHSYIINVNLNPQFFGQGIGSKMIRNSTDFFFKEKSEINTVIAEIFEDNIASQKAFQKAGFRYFEKMVKQDRKMKVFICKR